jgi:hypothetical protein
MPPAVNAALLSTLARGLKGIPSSRSYDTRTPPPFFCVFAHCRKRLKELYKELTSLEVEESSFRKN